MPQPHLAAGLDAWAAYAGGDTERDPLVQLAITHVEFEALHPFKDGNGRLGRMIIPLFLFGHKLLHGPNFYMSGYLEARREEYVERMRAVSRDGAWTEWCIFFLQGLIEQASENQAKATAILALYQRMLRQVADITRSHYAANVVDFIFDRPIFSTVHFAEHAGIPRPSALRFLPLLRGKGVLWTVREGGGRRPAIFAFRELLDIAEEHPVL
jgi:Fic family protein